MAERLLFIGAGVCEKIPGAHRRRKELEDKAKVVASVWGGKFVQFLAVPSVLPWSR